MIEAQKNKLYYSIGEVAKLFNVKTSHIRFWEKEFAILKPKKNKKGNRLFTKEDIYNIEKIYQLVKIEGYTLDGAKLQLKSNTPIEVADDANVVIGKLLEIKSQLLKIRNEI
ncbi:MerR family transcriptional regulator [Crocinitomix catalasitica]|uniref:MerR family transcriptional regulator n=1 Tax=Crocinitomix catalasitica TaxID=184607 RepID=UPI000A0721EF|nr:MerR family transcriptional regulator [Crocinitomix catalasitica]